jgi:uncharacterized protein YbjT (DUF2867 family)
MIPEVRNILITGYSGTVGSAVMEALRVSDTEGIRVLRAGHDVEVREADYRYLDFTDPATFAAAIEGVDYVFFLRPPQLTSVEEVFGPLLDRMEEAGVRGLVFLSVYGAGENTFVPHHKIEVAIRERKLSYYFLRPTYFMQNLTTTLYDQVRHGRLRLPAGRAVFNWVDARDIGAAAAHLLTHFPEGPVGEAITLAGEENLDFHRVSELSWGSELAFSYASQSLPAFLLARRRAGSPWSYALTVAAIHYLQRWQKSVSVRTDWRRLIGRDAGSLKEFFDRASPPDRVL